ncbi:MAG: hypothetical protein ACRDNH_06250 [Gaiellaceae bacterium]
MAGALALAAHAALEEPALGLFGAAGAAVLAVAILVGRAGLVAPALVLVAAGYAATLVARDARALDPAAPLVACALLLVAELAYWSVELASSGRAEPRVLLRRLAALVGLAATALALAAGVLAATAMPFGGGLAWNLIGIIAAAGAIALIAELSRRSGAGGEPTQPGDTRPHRF